MKFSLSGVSPCQDDPVEIILLTIGPSVSELRVFLSEVSPCQDDPVEILPLAMGLFVSELQVFSYKKKYFTGPPFYGQSPGATWAVE